MKPKYRWAIVTVITLLSLLVASPRESDAQAPTCRVSNTVEWEQQENANWCWVATVSMVLKSHDLRDVDQCQLYDLAMSGPTSKVTSCTDMKKISMSEWEEKYNERGSPLVAAKAYDEHHHNKIQFELPRQHPFESFEALASEICPSDGSAGTPFIWAYLHHVEPPNKVVYHDVVVYGYEDGGGEKYIYYHDPASAPPDVLLDPDFNFIAFDAYAEPSVFKEDFFIKKK